MKILWPGIFNRVAYGGIDYVVRIYSLKNSNFRLSLYFPHKRLLQAG